MSDFDPIDLIEAAMKEALIIMLEEEAEIQQLIQQLSAPSPESRHQQVCLEEQSRTNWLLRGRLSKLSHLGKSKGWVIRTPEQWYSLLFFGCFASPPTTGCKYGQCPTYPAHKMIQLADYTLSYPESYYGLLGAFRNYQTAAQQRRF